MSTATPRDIDSVRNLLVRLSLDTNRNLAPSVHTRSVPHNLSLLWHLGMLKRDIGPLPPHKTPKKHKRSDGTAEEADQTDQTRPSEERDGDYYYDTQSDEDEEDPVVFSETNSDVYPKYPHRDDGMDDDGIPATEAHLQNLTLTHAPLDPRWYVRKQNHCIDTVMGSLREKKNVVLSPFSLMSCMAMICRGASRGQQSSNAGRAYKQLAYYCWPTDDDGAHFDAAAHAALQRFVTQLARNPVCEWANIIMSDNMEKQYKEDVTEYFHAQEYPLDQWKKVNQKVAAVTKIKSDVLESQPAEGTSVLINAIYFLDKWVFPFNEGDTGMQFHAIDGTHKFVNMMTHQTTLRVAKHGHITAVNMLYRTPGMGVWFVKNSTSKGFQDAVAFETLSSFLQQEFVDRTLTSSEERLTLQVPKFELKDEIDLRQVFQGLPADAHPITDIFTPGHIDRMSTDKQEHFSVFRQNCILKVDQKGTKAAAVTYAKTTRGRQPPRYNVTFAHTFYMVIYHHDTILFVAKIGSPQEVVPSGRTPLTDDLPDTTDGHVSSHFAQKEQNLQVGLTIKFIDVKIGGTMRSMEINVKEHDGKDDEEGEDIDAKNIQNKIASESNPVHTNTYTVSVIMLIRVTIKFPSPGDTKELKETKIGLTPVYVKDNGATESEDRIELAYDEPYELPFPLQKEAGEEEDGWQLQDDNGNVFLKLRFKL